MELSVQRAEQGIPLPLARPAKFLAALRGGEPFSTAGDTGRAIFESASEFDDQDGLYIVDLPALSQDMVVS